MFRKFLVALLVVLSCSEHSMAQTDYPSKPVRMVVPYPPGGSVDSAARAVSQKLAERIGQPVVVENRPGAAGMIGSDVVAKSPPDGYTLVWGTVSSHAINIPAGRAKNSLDLFGRRPYVGLKYLRPLAQRRTNTKISNIG